MRGGKQWRVSRGGDEWRWLESDPIQRPATPSPSPAHGWCRTGSPASGRLRLKGSHALVLSACWMKSSTSLSGLFTRVLSLWKLSTWMNDLKITNDLAQPDESKLEEMSSVCFWCVYLICLFFGLYLAQLGEERVKDWHLGHSFSLTFFSQQLLSSKCFFSTKMKILSGCFFTWQLCKCKFIKTNIHQSAFKSTTDPIMQRYTEKTKLTFEQYYNT